MCPRLLTLNSNFLIPFYREILLLLGVCSVSKRSCERIPRKGNGSVIAIVVGGPAESPSAHPGTDLTLQKMCVVLSSARFDAGVDRWSCLPDWGSSSLRFGKGLSYNPLCTGHALIFRLHSADLVPVILIRGERRASSRLFLACALVLHRRRIRSTNKCRTKRVRYCTRFKRSSKMPLASHFHYFMGVGYLTIRHLRLSTLDQTDSPADNWGLLPYHRQIIAVSEQQIVVLIRLKLEGGLISLRRSVGRSTLRRRTTRLSNKSGKCRRRI